MKGGHGRANQIPQNIVNYIQHFFGEYPPIVVEEVKNNSGKVFGIKSWNSGLTYNQLVSRIDTLEKEHTEMKTQITNLSKNVSKNNTRRNNKNNGNNRKNRKGFVQTLRNRCKGNNCSV